MNIEDNPNSLRIVRAVTGLLQPIIFAAVFAGVGVWLDSKERIVFWMILGVLVDIQLNLPHQECPHH